MSVFHKFVSVAESVSVAEPVSVADSLTLTLLSTLHVPLNVLLLFSGSEEKAYHVFDDRRFSKLKWNAHTAHLSELEYSPPACTVGSVDSIIPSVTKCIAIPE